MIDKTNYEIWFLDYLEGNLSAEQEIILMIFVDNNPLLKQELEEMSLVFLVDDPIPFEAKVDLKKELSGSFDIEDMLIAKKEGDLSIKENITLDQYFLRDKSLLESLIYVEKTNLPKDDVLFDTKENLRKDQYSLDEMDTLLLSYLDETISISDKKWLEAHLEKDVLEKHLNRFRKTRLIADESIVFPSKNKLYQKEQKVIPLFWVSRIVGIAASFLVLLFAYQMWDSKNDIGQSPLIVNGTETIDHNENIALINKGNDSFDKNPPVAVIPTNKPDNNLTGLKNKDLILKNQKRNSQVNNIKKQLIPPTKNMSNKTENIDLEMNIVKEVKGNDGKSKYAIDKIGVVQNLGRRNISNLNSLNTTNVYLRMNRSKGQRNLLDIKELVQLEKDNEETGRILNLGLFDIEVPELLIASVEAVQGSKKSYEKAKKRGRNVFSFAIGGVSFYRSNKEE